MSSRTHFGTYALILFSIFVLWVILSNNSYSDGLQRGIYQNPTVPPEQHQPEEQDIKISDIPQDVEDLFKLAERLENEGRYQDALDHYRHYHQQAVHSVNREHARFKIKLIDEALSRNAVPALRRYLQALYHRRQNDFTAAHRFCLRLINEFPQSHLADDALHLSAYIKLVDEADYQGAIETYTELLERYPDTAYVDSALYGQALSYEHQQQYEPAQALLLNLEKKHTAFSIGLVNVALPKDNLLSRLWFNRAKRRLDILRDKVQLKQRETEILANGDFNFGMGARLTYDQPVGSRQHYRYLWHLLEERNLPVSYLTHWITRKTNWQWESRQKLQAAVNAGYTPVISYWYFGDEISPGFVKQNLDAYYRDIQEHLIPLIQDIPNVMILLEPEFNKNGIPGWGEWDAIESKAISLIRQGAPHAKIGLVAGDWGHYEAKDTLANIEQSVERSDFIGFMLMSSASYEQPIVNPAWQLVERGNRMADFLQGRFNKPIYMAYLALSTDQNWQQKQAVYIQQIFQNIPYYIDRGIFGLSFFSLFDNPDQQGWFANSEQHFGLLTLNAEEKPGAGVWRENVAAILRQDDQPPKLAQPLQVNTDTTVSLFSPLIGQAIFSEWVRWKVEITGSQSGAFYQSRGAGKGVWFRWSGQAHQGAFTQEPYILTLSAMDKADNPFSMSKEVNNTFVNPANETLVFESALTANTVHSWGSQTRLQYGDGHISIRLMSPLAGLNMGLASSNQDWSDYKQKAVIQLRLRLHTKAEGLYLGIDDQRDQRRKLMLEAYLNTRTRHWQTIYIPLRDFLGILKDEERFYWEGVKKMVLFTISEAVSMDIKSLSVILNN